MSDEQTKQTIDDGGPAFPNPTWAQGMSTRTYAAIELKVPESGIDWLDDMIRQANKRELAGMAMQGIWATSDQLGDHRNVGLDMIADWAFEQADAMIAQLRKDSPNA